MSTENKKRLELVLTSIFILLTIVFIFQMAFNSNFFDWAFERHQNKLSWAVRPFILLPICFFAYKRSALGISVSVFLGLASMAFFPVPEVIDPQVQDFLNIEKDYLTSGWTIGKVAITMLVPISMTLLGMAFWKRSLKTGLIIIVLIAVTKTVWSVVEGGQSGQSVIAPAVIGLIISIFVIYYAAKRIKANKV